MLRQAHRRIYLFALAVLAACSILVLSTPLIRAQAPAATFLSFDAPGAGTAQNQGTFPLAINRSGLIVGYFTDSSNVQHGFMRDPDGTFTIVDVPGSIVTRVTAVNSKGLVAGFSYSSKGIPAGFLRYLNGTLLTLNAVKGSSYTIPAAINDIDQIAGNVWFSSNITRGFLWSPTQSFKIFSVPYGGSWVGVTALNSSGMIAGSYPGVIRQTWLRGFVRDDAGNFSSFAAIDGALRTYPTAINASGQVTGWYVDAHYQGLPFLRDADGTITLFTVGTGDSQATSINDLGVVVGTAYSATFENAFKRDPAGNVTMLTLPFSNVGTAVGINLRGQIVGAYNDSTFVTHGWLMTP